jgi:hypothetical protein
MTVKKIVFGVLATGMLALGSVGASALAAQATPEQSASVSVQAGAPNMGNDCFSWWNVPAGVTCRLFTNETQCHDLMYYEEANFATIYNDDACTYVPVAELYVLEYYVH